MSKSQVLRFAFYPRPPGGGRRHFSHPYQCDGYISIHALRVEGDPALFRLPISFPNFYPRPPDGGRQSFRMVRSCLCIFLSTSSGRRATTAAMYRKSLCSLYFYPRPPGGGRHRRVYRFPAYPQNFYPRPPGGGRPNTSKKERLIKDISIHALRVEGDVDTRLQLRERGMISIHALRVEGDC